MLTNKVRWPWRLLMLSVIAVAITTTISRTWLSKRLPKPVFDVPALIGKDLNGVVAVLGPATEAPAFKTLVLLPGQTNYDGAHQTWKWHKDGVMLLANFDLYSNPPRIVSFGLSTDESVMQGMAKEHLLALGNLTEKQTRYRVKTYFWAEASRTLPSSVEVEPYPRW